MRLWTEGENVEMNPVVHVPGYKFRIVVPIDDVLYDPHVGNWVEDDGRIPICDVGGQPQNTRFDEGQGHGGIWWLMPDDTLAPGVPWGHVHRGMPMFPRLAPPSFGRHAGSALVLCQVYPGRQGAHLDHVVHMWDRRSDQLVLFSVLPRNESAAGNGIPFAMIAGAYGPEGTEYEGGYYFTSLGNASVYRVNGDGRPDTVAIMDGVKGPKLLLRSMCFGTDDCFPEHKGKLIVGGVPGADWIIGANNEGRKIGQEVAFHLIENGKANPDPFFVGNRMYAWPVRSSANFGPLSKTLFYSDNGTINQSQSIYDHGPLPHDGAILYADASGEIKPLVTGLRGGRNDMLIAGDRLIVSHWGKSYATGEFHEPDGAIWEITYDPSSISG